MKTKTKMTKRERWGVYGVALAFSFAAAAIVWALRLRGLGEAAAAVAGAVAFALFVAMAAAIYVVRRFANRRLAWVVAPLVAGAALVLARHAPVLSFEGEPRDGVTLLAYPLPLDVLHDWVPARSVLLTRRQPPDYAMRLDGTTLRLVRLTTIEGDSDGGLHRSDE